MINKNYTSKEKIDNFLGVDVTINLIDYILSAQQYIDTFTGRTFANDTNESIKLINGNSGSILQIPEATEITKLEIASDGWGDNFTEILTADYKLISSNDGLSANKIALRSSIFTTGLGNVRLTGKWSMGEIPADLSFCATVIASGMYNAQLAGGVLKSESIGQYSVSYDDKDWAKLDKVKQILQSYQKLFI